MIKDNMDESGKNRYKEVAQASALWLTMKGWSDWQPMNKFAYQSLILKNNLKWILKFSSIFKEWSGKLLQGMLCIYIVSSQ